MKFKINNIRRKIIFLVFSLLTFYFLLLTFASAQPEPLMDAITKAVRAELVRSVSADIEIGRIRILKGLDDPNEDSGYTIGSLVEDGYNNRNKIVYRISLYDDKKTVHTVVVEAAYEVLADVFVAARPLSAGTVISKDDIYAVKQKTSRLPMGAITDKAGIEGKKIRLNVAEGVIIRSDYLSNASAVKKGSEVTVLVEGDNVLVSTKGVLRNDTAVGNVAHVICTASKKEVDGMLVSSDTVKVKI